VAEIDINAEIAIAQHLFAISPRVIGLNKTQLDAVQELLHDAHGPTSP
jgi:hypothetical protein